MCRLPLALDPEAFSLATWTCLCVGNEAEVDLLFPRPTGLFCLGAGDRADVPLPRSRRRGRPGRGIFSLGSLVEERGTDSEVDVSAIVEDCS